MQVQRGWAYRAMWPAEVESVSQARAFVADLLAGHDLVHLRNDIVLVVSELATNAVQHARTPFEVSLERSEGVLNLAVSDSSSLPPRAQEQRPDAIAGRGLFLVYTLSDSWGIDCSGDDGKRVWATFRV
jgi:anti-sigma regulatory factor (Ser/Thr protein kinase)